MLNRRRSTGFTAVELMIALAVFALVASLAAPSFRVFVGNQQLRSASFDLVSDLVTARSEALKRNAEVAVIPDEDGWANGWTVQVVDGDQLRTREALGSGLTIETDWTDVVFDRSGRVAAPIGVPTFSLDAEDIDGVTARCVTLDPTGRARSERRPCDGMEEEG